MKLILSFNVETPIKIEPTKTTARCHECNCFLYLGCRRRLVLFVHESYSLYAYYLIILGQFNLVLAEFYKHGEARNDTVFKMYERYTAAEINRSPPLTLPC